MPIFEFECRICGTIFEDLCTASEIIKCVNCGSENVIKKMTAPAPLKKGAFPFKPGPVHPLAKSPNRPMACGACHTQNGNNDN